MISLTRFVSVLLFLCVAGCGADSRQAADFADGSKYPASEAPGDINLNQSGLTLHNYHDIGVAFRSSHVGEAVVDEEGNLAADPTSATKRKIIYVAQISLVVEDFARIEGEIPQLVKQFNGYLADITVDRIQGAYRTGQWVVRIPVEKYDPFLAELEKLGIPEHLTQNAQDVTEEFVDLEARIATKKQLEKRILQLVEDREGKIKEVIEVERELARVREEIERMEGRLRYLANRTALTTVTINVREEKDYVPPQAPSFTSSIASAWTNSIEALTGFGKATVIAGVAFFPWLILVLPLLLLIRWGWKRLQIGHLSREDQAR